MTVVGVISDTHGLLRPQATEYLQGSELIIHAGDIGSLEVIVGLERIAPVRAVSGNVDNEPWAHEYAEKQVVELNGKQLYVLHDLMQLDLDPVTAGIAAIISGHSHNPKVEVKNGVLYLNPGSAGPRRFDLPISLGKLTLGSSSISAEIHKLDE